MSNPVIFRRGNVSDFGTSIDDFLSGDSDSLYFVEDTSTLYKSVGVNKPLVRFSDVLSGFINEDDLLAKVSEGINGKLYLTDSGKIYYYSNDEWKTIMADADLESFSSEKVTFNPIDTTLSSTNTSDAIKELDDKLSDVTVWRSFEF